MFLERLNSCKQYVQVKLHNGSQREILLEKNVTIERLKGVARSVSC